MKLTSASRPYPPPLPNPCWCILGNASEDVTCTAEECPVHGEHPWPPPGERDAWKGKCLYWVFASHDHGRPLGEASGPYEHLAEAVDALLPGGVVMQMAAASGSWLGERAEWPVLPAEPA